MKSRHHRDTSVPVLAHADTLVVEGTLAGCVAAHASARAGRRTVLTSFACSLPYEMSVCRRPWAEERQLHCLPEPFRAAFIESISHKLGSGEVLLNLARLAIRVEDILLDAGVRLFYGLTPCGVRRGRTGAVRGVVYGGKSGLDAITAGQIIDCSQSAAIPTMAGLPPARRQKPGRPVTVRLAARIGVADDDTPVTRDRDQLNTCPTEWPREATLDDGRIKLHGPYAEIDLRLRVDTDDPLWAARLSNDARLALIEGGARIARRRRAQGKRPLFFHRFSGGLLTEPLFRCSAKGLDNVWVCGPCADVDNRRARRLANPYAACRFAAELVRRMIGRRPRSRATPAHLPAPPRPRPVAEYDVIVAGGGTSGVPAALAAARSGARTVLIEQHPDVGGVRTIGGVGSYWFGRETLWQRACDDAYDRCSERSGMAEELSMLHCLTEAGVRVLTCCPTVGVVREDDRVTGVVVAAAGGLHLVKGKVIVDATGDADVAAWAGAPFEFGSGRDAWTLWASFANFNEERRAASRQYDSSLDTRDARDLTRTVITGRRRQGIWRNDPHEMPQHYVAPRESRRIAAEATVTYTGIIAGETFADTMIVCDSNFDLKGIATSDAACCGLVASWGLYTRYLAAVPYRAVLPKGIGNLLIACRAYSASHDALSLARMQRDMVNLGAAAGAAAALAARTGTPPARLDVPALQGEWVRLGVLRAADLRRFGRSPAPYGRKEAERDADGLLSGGGRWQVRLARLMRSRASIGPLRRAFDRARSRATRVKIARALCYLGDSTAVPYLLESAAAQVRNSLPRPRRRTPHPPPEHGRAAEPAYSLYAVGLTERGADAGPLMEKIARSIEDDADLFASPGDSPFEYVRTICAVAERNPGPRMLPALEALFAKACLRGLAVPHDADPRQVVDSVLERRAWLELSLGRALARCGDRRGFAILRAYCDDIRAPLARSAADELADLRVASAPRTATKAYRKRLD